MHSHTILAALALAGLTAGCGVHTHDGPHGASGGAVEAASPSELPGPSDTELEAKAKQQINEANADAEFEKLKQEIEADDDG